MTQIITITGGTISGSGKGVFSASLGAALQDAGFSVEIMKFDPYLNYNAGWLSPEEHGEVFITNDGGQSDLDLGHYERFLDKDLTADHCITAGRIYGEVINSQPNGKTLQVIPDIIKGIHESIRFIIEDSRPDYLLVEIGGTVGDVESTPFIHAIARLKNALHIHVGFIIYLSTSGEWKTKTVQHSVSILRGMGVNPDYIVCRSDSESKVPLRILQKVALTCLVPKSHVIGLENVSSIYALPYRLLTDLVPVLADSETNSGKWTKIHNVVSTMKIDNPTVIGIPSKYSTNKDAYKSIYEALTHAQFYVAPATPLLIETFDVEKLDTANISHYNGIIIPGGFGERGLEDKIQLANYTRINNVPTLGICLGMQVMAIEWARFILKDNNISSDEFTNYNNNVIIEVAQGNMLLGTKPISILPTATLPSEFLGSYYFPTGNVNLYERFRNRYVIDPDKLEIFSYYPMSVPAFIDKGFKPPAAIELVTHPFYVGVQYHPEFKSRINDPHPLFTRFLKKANVN